MTIAEQIAGVFVVAAGTFRTVDGQKLQDVCRHRQVREDADPNRELVRHVFADGSAIVEGVGGWDIEGNTPFSWEGE